MLEGEFRIFLSAVTSEFGKARDAVAADLRSREVALLRVQSDRSKPGRIVVARHRTLSIGVARVIAKTAGWVN